MRPAVGLLVAAGAVALPWLVDAYAIAVAAHGLALGVLALSVHVYTGLAGQPTLGQGAYLGVGAYVAAHLARDAAPGLIQLASAAAAGGLVAAATGLAVVRTRGVATVMLTLAIAEIAYTSATRWKAVTGGSDGLTVPATAAWPGGPTLVLDGHVYLWLLSVASLAYLGVLLVGRSPFGLALRGVAENEARMAALGYPVARLLWTAHLAAGALAGLSGAMWVAAHRYVSPADVGLGISALALLAVVIGGTGSATGAVAAAAVVVVVDEIAAHALPGAFAGRGPLLLGALFVVCVYALPRGLAGVVERTRRA